MRWSPVLSLLLCSMVACAGDGTGLDENGIPIGTPPPRTDVTLSSHVQPILTANCALSGCHAGGSPALGQNLSAGQTHANVVNVPSQEVPGMMRVRPLLPDSSYLVHKIQGTQGSVGGSGVRMPLSAGPLTAGQIATIRAWITAGALNN